MIELIFAVPLSLLVLALVLICVCRWCKAAHNMQHLYATDETDEENQITEEDVRSSMNTRVLEKSSLRSGRRKKKTKKAADDYNDLEASMKSGISIASYLSNTKDSNVCPICIDTFEVGDEVASSKNGGCQHVFHASCITSWLILPKSGGCCPLCRQEFLTVDKNSNDTHDEISSEEESA